jgi:hypothetical protein
MIALPRNVNIQSPLRQQIRIPKAKFDFIVVLYSEECHHSSSIDNDHIFPLDINSEEYYHKSGSFQATIISLRCLDLIKMDFSRASRLSVPVRKSTSSLCIY